jgi:5-methylcytosine-specific restriction enzyme A
MPADKFEYEHRTALCNGGENRETNIFLCLADKHREKTADDVAIKSKVARIAAKNRGLWPKSPFKIRSRGFDKRRATDMGESER